VGAEPVIRRDQLPVPVVKAPLPASLGIDLSHGFCAAVPEVRIHLPPVKSLVRTDLEGAESSGLEVKRIIRDV
jgi:hypothetical protein